MIEVCTMEEGSPGRSHDLSGAKRRLLELRMRGHGVRAVTAIAPRALGSRTPASAEQSRIWLHAALEPELAIYNESVTVHREGTCDAALLEASLNAVLARHEAWRTSFRMDDGELLQVVHAEVKVVLPVVDLTHLALERRDDAASRIASEDARIPIDVREAPLFRARLIRMAEGKHWLQITLHHILFDGVCLRRVFVPELAEIYAALEGGSESGLAWPEVQYADYAIWHREYVQTAEVAGQLAYWQRQLGGELPVLRLPSDRARPATTSHRGAVESFTFPAEVTEALRGLARAQGSTLYMVLLAGLKALFFRYSGQEDVMVGGLADGRRRPELEHAMGCFLQTFALRTRPGAEISFADYLLQVRETVLEALAAAEIPFDRVVQTVRPQREHSGHPLFQTFFSFQPEGEDLPAGWSVSKTRVEVETSKFDLYLEVEERRGCLSAQWMYSTDLFDAVTVQRMAGHWMTLLDGATMIPECALGDLPLLTDEERETMLVTWNRTELPLPAMPVHEAVRARARATPDNVAAEFEGSTWTYGELEGRADEMARRLRRAGARAGALVAVCLERSLEMLSTLLAILKTGAAYLPLDPGTPIARRMMCLEDAKPMLLVTQRGLEEDLPGGTWKTIFVGESGSRGLRGEDEPGSADLRAAAYVIHTSGSTGRPKGVEIAHGALMNLLLSMQERPGFRANDTLLAVTTVSFDIAGLEMFLPLICGGRVAIVSRAVALDPYLLAGAIEDSSCTVMQATPATWRSLLSTGWQGRDGLRVLCGGEAMPRDLAESLLSLGLEVWNVYGPTETTIWSTVERVAHGLGPVAVGRPIGNTSAYILDRRMQPVPVGVQGELYLGGAGVAIGYRDQPEMTAQRFLTSVLTSGERLYRTGDYAVYRADGKIEVQGRTDNQVKVRGYRIELEEVEAALCSHPKVSSAAAKVWPDASGGNRLSGYVVGTTRGAPTLEEMRSFLSGCLPDYMVPSSLTVLDAMPLTANGKMDRKALVEPVVEADDPVSSAPRTDVERRLVSIWAELLGTSAIGMEDNFFDLGGHSLLVARLQARMEAAFGRRVSMAAIFHAPTPAGQMALLGRVDGDVDAARILRIQPSGNRPHLLWLEPTRLIGNLAAGLGKDQPLLGVAMTREDLEGLGPEPDLHSLAACHVKVILSAQPCGPYSLGGLCTSGILAYEVACQLAAAGHAVASVTMLDSENPVFYRRLDRASVEIAKLRFYGRRVLRRRGLQMFLRHVQGRMRRLLWLKPKAKTEMSAVDHALLQAALRYKTSRYGGDVLLLLPRDRPEVVDYASGWREVVGGRLTCIEVDCHHDELLDADSAVAVGEALRTYLGGEHAAQGPGS